MKDLILDIRRSMQTFKLIKAMRDAGVFNNTEYNHTNEDLTILKGIWSETPNITGDFNVWLNKIEEYATENNRTPIQAALRIKKDIERLQ
jgi:hypothetical protein